MSQRGSQRGPQRRWVHPGSVTGGTCGILVDGSGPLARVSRLRAAPNAVTSHPPNDPDPPSAARPLSEEGPGADFGGLEDGRGRRTGEPDGLPRDGPRSVDVVTAWESLQGDAAALRADWGSLDGQLRASSLAGLEARLFGLEEASSGSLGGADSARHARSVTLSWRGHLERSGSSGASGRLGSALTVNRSRWLAARRAEALLEPEKVFAALMRVEEFLLAGVRVGQAASGSPSDPRRSADARVRQGELSETQIDASGAQAGDSGAWTNDPERQTFEEGQAPDEVSITRAELRRSLASHAAAGRLDADLRTAMAGRMVDHADDAILLTGEATSAECVGVLREAEDALLWHLAELEAEPGRDRARLARRLRRVERELVEQRLQLKLETRFGEGRVALWERMVVASILGVLVLLVLEVARAVGVVDLGLPDVAMTAVDTLICGFLLVDFGVKLAFVSRRRLWLRRHIWTDFLPALPFGLISGLDGLVGEAGQASRLLRLLRLARLGAYLRALRPVIWFVRALGFLLRGLDRVVRRHAAALEMEVILFPTPAEQREVWRRDAALRRGLSSLRRSLDAWFHEAHTSGDLAAREVLEAARAEVLEGALERTAAAPSGDPGRRRHRLPLAEDLLRQLSEVSGEELVEQLGSSTVERLARAARLVALSPLRWLPGLGSWAAPDALGAAAAEHVSRSVHVLAAGLHRALRRVLWWADLHGTLTPGEVVGRIGSALVARTSRPAVRLLLFGIPFLGVQLALMALDPEGDAELKSFAVIRLISGVVGTAFYVLGGSCLVLLAIGSWLQRMARDTTTFHEKVARAQFLYLMDSLKARRHDEDASFLRDRVFRPERALRGESDALVEADGRRFHSGLKEFLQSGEPLRSGGDGFDHVARALLLYRDQLDGALLAHTDTRATSQLLGNLAVRRFAGASGRVTASRLRWMQSLDLERRRTLVRGPYLWFHAISRSLETRAARLIVEYNAHAIPESDLERASEGERAAHRRWLDGAAQGDEAEGRGGADGDALHGGDDGDEGGGKRRLELRAGELTTAFTVLHFLDAHAGRDGEIERRFGTAVADKMRRDRRALVRSVFGTYPLHLLPLESRVLNLRSLYEDWLQGGRVVVLPLRLGLVMSRLLAAGFGRLIKAVRVIRRPGVALESGPDHEAGFDVAARKIQRMRGPAAVAAMELRAILDPEYHGVTLPAASSDSMGAAESSAGLAGAGVPWRAQPSAALADARFLGADPTSIRLLRSLRRRAGRDVARLEASLLGGLKDRLAARLGVDPTVDAESLRCLYLYVLSDADGVRSALFGEEVLVDTVVDALLHGAKRPSARPRLRLRLAFRRWWTSGGEQRVTRAALAGGALPQGPGERLDRSPADGASPEASDLAWRRRQARRRLRRTAWRVVAADVDGARACLVSALSGTGSPERLAAEERLASALRHPSRTTEQVVALRATQSLTLLDIRNYRRQVWLLGDYGADGDPEPAPLPGAV